MKPTSHEADSIEKETTICVKECKENTKYHNFDEAIDLSGNGWYNIGLLITSGIALTAMFIDMFSFAVVVSYASCDLQLTQVQKSILVSVPFAGPVATAYAWGYFSDTKGRKTIMSIGMIVSFVLSTLSAFSPNWITMAVFKFFGTCFCSCAQSGSFTWLGESCSVRVKASYLIVMSSLANLGLPCYMTMAYLVGQLDFYYDLGFISFVPWRLLVLVLALPLGLGAVLTQLFFESPKFLLNAGREVEALDILRKIHKRNRVSENYPVQNLLLNEVGNIKRKEESLLASLWQQTAPLFCPPLVWNTLILYYLILVSYSISGSLYIWLPFISKAFTSPALNETDGFCTLLQMTSTITTTTHDSSACSSSTIELELVLVTVASGIFFSTCTVIMSRFALRRKASLIFIFAFACICCAITTLIPNKIAGIFYFGGFSTSLIVGPCFSYFVDQFPTSFRGMAACLGVMVARISSVAGVNFVGPFLTSYCTVTFYSISAFAFSGILVSLLLPADKSKSTTETNTNK